MHIDSYSFGYMSIDGRGYTTDLITYPDGSVQSGWWRQEGHRLNPEDLERTRLFKPDVVIIGTGANGMMKVPNETLRFIKTFCSEVVVEDTGAAVRAFNVTSDGRRIVGMFHLTC
jgi:hypothetical protein